MNQVDPSGIVIPEDLMAIDPSQIVSSRSTGYGTGGFVQRVPDGVDAVAMAAQMQQAAPPGALAGSASAFRQPPDSQYLTTGLPSGCLLYGMADNSMGIRRFNNDDVLKIYDARAESSLRMLAEVVGATLDRFSIWDLTVGDFWFLMYWHRLHSYPKSPFIVDYTCTADAHLEKIRKSEVSVDTLNQQMILKNSDLQTVSLEVTPLLQEIAAIKHEFGITSTVMRMGDYVRIVEMEEENEDLQNRAKLEDIPYVPKYKASDFLRARHAAKLDRVHGQSLEQRMEALRKLSDFQMWPRLDRLDILGDHGVVETYSVVCKECGTRTKVEVALDALTFLPEL